MSVFIVMHLGMKLATISAISLDTATMIAAQLHPEAKLFLVK